MVRKLFLVLVLTTTYSIFAQAKEIDFGLTIGLQVKGRFGLQFEPGFTRKGSIQEPIGTFDGFFVEHHYLVFPLHLRSELIKDLNVLSGLEYGYRWKTKTGPVDSEEYRQGLARNDLGISFGLSYTVPDRFLIEIRFIQGFLSLREYFNIFESVDCKEYNCGIVFNLGYLLFHQ